MKQPARWYWILLLVPYVWIVLAIPAVNTIRFHPWGLPFLFIWMLLGIPISSLCIGMVYVIDNRGRTEHPEKQETR